MVEAVFKKKKTAFAFFYMLSPVTGMICFVLSSKGTVHMLICIKYVKLQVFCAAFLVYFIFIFFQFF